MPLRFIHTADIHLGAPLRFLRDKTSSHKKLLGDAFNRVVEHALKVRADAVLVCGDLFDTTMPSVYNLDLVKRGIEKLSNSSIHTVLIPGNHDHRIGGGSYSKVFPKGEFVHVVENASIYIKELDTLIHGYTLKEGQALNIERDESECKYRIAMIHGSIDIGKDGMKREVELNSLKRSSFDYIALGDWHGLLELAPNIYYSGSPEVLDSKQGKSGYILDVSLGDDLKVVKEKVGVIEVSDVVIDMSRFKDIEEVLKYIEGLKDDKKIINIRLQGMIGAGLIINELEIKEYLSDLFYLVNVYNGTKFVLSKDELMELSSGFVIGHYVSYLEGLRGKVDDKIIDRAIALGVNKLLESED